jgi:hypothetical protein
MGKNTFKQLVLKQVGNNLQNMDVKQNTIKLLFHAIYKN